MVDVDGTQAGGLALLACLDTKTIREIIKRNSAAYPANKDLDEENMWKRVRNAQERGRVVSGGTVFPGTSGTAVPIPNGSRPPYLAIGIGGVDARMPPERLETLHDELSGIARQLAASLANSIPSQGEERHEHR